MIVSCVYAFSDGESDSSEDEGMSTFLDHHRRACSVQRERESVAREIVARDVEKSGLNKLPEMPKKCKNTHNISPDSTVRNNFSERL